MEKVITIAAKAEEKILRQKTKEFVFEGKGAVSIGNEKFSKKEIDELVRKMRKIMREAKGVGLSANQIGLNYRLFVAEVPSRDGGNKFYAVFNPRIEKLWEETIAPIDEGCLSVPKIFGQVERATQVKISGLDKAGRPVKIKAWGLLAQIFQHEIDHLDGELFIDKAKELRKVSPNNETQ